MFTSMKITGPAAIQPPTPRREKIARGSGGKRFAAELDGASAHPAAGGGHVEGLEGLLALQEVPDPTAERRRATVRGEELLERLDDIRLGLLAGRLPESALRGLLTAVQRQGTNVSDPELRGILEEIELRAAVELAKLGQNV